MERIELIELALAEIGRECHIIDRLSTECRNHIDLIEAKGKEVDGVLRGLQKQHDDTLKEIHEQLRDVLENVGEYMNAHDIVQPVDLAINKAVYDLVYERTTDKDYEEGE